MDERQEELARYRLKEAEEALQSGQALLKMGDCRGAINRFYYGAFYATQALLILKGKDARTHSGNLHLFREEFIKTGLLPAEAGRMLSRLLDERIESDYAAMSEPGRKDAEQASEDCRLFLRQARTAFNALV